MSVFLNPNAMYFYSHLCIYVETFLYDGNIFPFLYLINTFTPELKKKFCKKLAFTPMFLVSTPADHACIMPLIPLFCHPLADIYRPYRIGPFLRWQPSALLMSYIYRTWHSVCAHKHSLYLTPAYWNGVSVMGVTKLSPGLEQDA